MEDIRFDYTVEDIMLKTDDYMNVIKEMIGKICKLEGKDITYENVIWEYSNVLAENSRIIEPIVFLQQVAVEMEIREKSREVNHKLEEFFSMIYTNYEFYEKVRYVYEKKFNKLDEMEKKHVTYYMKKFCEYGMKMSSKKRELLNKLLIRINELEGIFDKNISEDTSYIILSKDELIGCSKEFIEEIENNEYKIIGRETRHIREILTKCDVEDTRRKVVEMLKTRCMENMEILEKMHECRQEISMIYNYRNNGEYKISDQMLNNVEDIEKLLKTMGRKLKEDTRKHNDELLEIKREMYKKDINVTRSKKRKIDEFTLNQWDYSYYLEKYIDQNYDIDGTEIAKYFQSENVMNEMLNFYGDLFGLEFIKMTKGKYPTWHKDVILYEVYEKEKNNENNENNERKERKERLMGYIYVDLYPREGKYDHFMMVDLLSGYKNKKTNKQELPMAVLVGNFSSPTGNIPALMNHDDISTLFHEFGHVIHGICGGYKNKYYEFSGTSVETDYVEIPSQMKEQWVWEPMIIKRISGHYITGDKLSDKKIEKLIQTKYIGKSWEWSRITGMSMVDQMIQRRTKLNKEEMRYLMNDIMEEYMPGKRMETFTTWTHMNGYDARYYSYLWTMIVACDLYSRFKDQPMEKQMELGMEYRRKIMEPGGTKEGKEMIRDFMGRDISIKSFMENYIGIEEKGNTILKLKSMETKKRKRND